MVAFLNFFLSNVVVDVSTTSTVKAVNGNATVNITGSGTPTITMPTNGVTRGNYTFILDGPASAIVQAGAGETLNGTANGKVSMTLQKTSVTLRRKNTNNGWIIPQSAVIGPITAMIICGIIITVSLFFGVKDVLALDRITSNNAATGTVAPAVVDDAADGLYEGSIYVDTATNTPYVSVDATVGAAIWTGLGGGGAPAAHAASHVGSDSIQQATAGQIGLMSIAYATKLDGIEAGADVTDAANVLAAGALMRNFFTAADQVLVSTGSDTYVVRTVGASNFFGRKATGAAMALSAAEARTILNVADGADVTANNPPQAHAASHVAGDAIQDATALQKGLMTDTYASKLDGIPAGGIQPLSAVTNMVANNFLLHGNYKQSWQWSLTDSTFPGFRVVTSSLLDTSATLFEVSTTHAAGTTIPIVVKSRNNVIMQGSAYNSQMLFNPGSASNPGIAFTGTGSSQSTGLAYISSALNLINGGAISLRAGSSNVYSGSDLSGNWSLRNRFGGAQYSENPTYSFASGTTDGMWTPGTGSLAFSTNALERLRIGDDGRIGIGTTVLTGSALGLVYNRTDFDSNVDFSARSDSVAVTLTGHAQPRTLFGLFSRTKINTAGFNAGPVIGASFIPETSGGGTATEVVGVEVGAKTTGLTGVIGLRVLAPTRVSGTQSSYMGLYVEPYTGAAINDAAIIDGLVTIGAMGTQHAGKFNVNNSTNIPNAVFKGVAGQTEPAIEIQDSAGTKFSKLFANGTMQLLPTAVGVTSLEIAQAISSGASTGLLVNPSMQWAAATYIGADIRIDNVRTYNHTFTGLRVGTYGSGVTNVTAGTAIDFVNINTAINSSSPTALRAGIRLVNTSNINDPNNLSWAIKNEIADPDAGDILLGLDGVKTRWGTNRTGSIAADDSGLAIKMEAVNDSIMFQRSDSTTIARMYDSQCVAWFGASITGKRVFNFLGGTDTVAPSTKTGQSALWTDSAGQMWVKGGASAAKLISEHSRNAPGWMYDAFDPQPQMGEQHYDDGRTVYINYHRMARLVQALANEKFPNDPKANQVIFDSADDSVGSKVGSRIDRAIAGLKRLVNQIKKDILP